MLPLPLTGLVGRERELVEVADLLLSTRLLTLTGVGGVGKTRLAIEVASRGTDRFSSGTWFVSLATLRDPVLVLSAVAQALGIPQAGTRPPLESVADQLRDRACLLVLDNFEHVIEAAPAIADLLASCSQLRILVTSRERLRLRGEQVYRVAPLSLGMAEKATGAPHAIAPEEPLPEAVQLFVERARAVQADFQLTPEHVASAHEICRRLDGLPLAIELATARLGLLSPPALLGYLDRRLPLLTEGARDLPDRQRTLADTLAWSYDLLTEPERRLFCGLSVFVGGCTFEAVAAVCGALPAPDPSLLNALGSLVEKSLLRAEEQDGRVRFSMLETVREYAAAQLEASGEGDALRRRHAVFHLEFAEHARADQYGPRAAAWLDQLEIDHGNIRAALDWGESEGSEAAGDIDPGGSPAEIDRLDLATRLVDAVAWFWMMRGHLHEGRDRQARLLARVPPHTRARARALVTSSGLARYRGDYEAAVALGEEGLALWRAFGDRRQVAVALARLGDAHAWRGEYAVARSYLEQSTAIFRELGGESGLEHPTILTLGQAAWVAGDLANAQRLFEESLATGRAVGDVHTAQVALRYLGLLAHRRGDLSRAVELLRESLRLVRALGDQACVMTGLAALAIAAASLGRGEQAARLLAGVRRTHELTGVALMPFLREAYEVRVTAARAHLGEEAFTRAWDGGSVLSLDEAVAEALEVQAAPWRAEAASPIGDGGSRQHEAPPAELTPREVEVLRLIAAGYSTRQIAKELVVTIPTVERHITHIYDKIGARGRAMATAFALRHGLG